MEMEMLDHAMAWVGLTYNRPSIVAGTYKNKYIRQSSQLDLDFQAICPFGHQTIKFCCRNKPKK